jgi:hypothetical protein
MKAQALHVIEKKWFHFYVSKYLDTHVFFLQKVIRFKIGHTSGIVGFNGFAPFNKRSPKRMMWVVVEYNACDLWWCGKTFALLVMVMMHSLCYRRGPYQ